MIFSTIVEDWAALNDEPEKHAVRCRNFERRKTLHRYAQWVARQRIAGMAYAGRLKRAHNMVAAAQRILDNAKRDYGNVTTAQSVLRYAETKLKQFQEEADRPLSEYQRLQNIELQELASTEETWNRRQNTAQKWSKFSTYSHAAQMDTLEAMRESRAEHCARAADYNTDTLVALQRDDATKPVSDDCLDAWTRAQSHGNMFGLNYAFMAYFGLTKKALAQQLSQQDLSMTAQELRFKHKRALDHAITPEAVIERGVYETEIGLYNHAVLYTALFHAACMFSPANPQAQIHYVDRLYDLSVFLCRRLEQLGLFSPWWKPFQCIKLLDMPSATAPTMEMVKQSLAQWKRVTELPRKWGQNFISKDEAASYLAPEKRDEIQKWIADCGDIRPDLPVAPAGADSSTAPSSQIIHRSHAQSLSIFGEEPDTYDWRRFLEDNEANDSVC